MKVNPYLNFNGRCEEAFKFYEKCLGGKIIAMFPFGGSPMEQHIPAEWHRKIMHASLEVGGEVIMGSDATPECYEQPQGITVSLNVESPADAERIFSSLLEGGTARMPLQETFWAHRFGMLVDQFGIPWMVNCAKPMA